MHSVAKVTLFSLLVIGLFMGGMNQYQIKMLDVQRRHSLVLNNNKKKTSDLNNEINTLHTKLIASLNLVASNKNETSDLNNEINTLQIKIKQLKTNPCRCRRDDTNSNQIFFTHPNPDIDPSGFNVCLIHQPGVLGMCVPAVKVLPLQHHSSNFKNYGIDSTSNSSKFRAKFPIGTEGDVRIMWMWDVVDWNQFKSRDMLYNPSLRAGGDAGNKTHWNGCDVQHNFKNTLWCDLKDVELRPSNIGDPMDGKKYKDFATLINHTHVETLFFVGDSTMKRVFDTAQGMCPHIASQKGVPTGKWHLNAKRQCGTIKMIYVWCAGACDAAEMIRKEVPNQKSIALLFDTGHQYINMNNADFLQQVQKLQKVIDAKDQVNWATWTNPAQHTAKWTNDMKCSHNNVLVQMKNEILRTHLPTKRTFETYWYTLQSGYHSDGVHFTGLPYKKMMEQAIDIWLASSRVTSNESYGSSNSSRDLLIAP